MDSVWYQMGMRDGAFRGTVPAAFMNNAYRFFLDLRDQCRKVLSPGYIPPESENKFSFNARDRYGRWRGYPDIIYRNMFTFQQVPMGSPLPEEVWNAPKPKWDKVNFTEEEILNEEIIPFGTFRGKPADSTEWETQRYRLIQKMRYCLIPLLIEVSTLDYQKRETWQDYHYNSGCVDQETFHWDYWYRLKVKIPDYWSQKNVISKIGINAENLTSANNVPINGSRWMEQKSFTTAKNTGNSLWLGTSKLRIYGAVDLASHPDFAKYFHHTTQTQGENN